MKAQIISFHCVLRNRIGQVLSSTFNQEVSTHIAGPDGHPLQALADGLKDLQKGEKRRIPLSADKAYGFYDPTLVIQASRKKLGRSKALQPGDEILLHGADTDAEPRLFRVLQVNGDCVTLDGNHPFAGQDLIFEIEATDTREATPEEIAATELENPSTLLH